MNLIMNHSTANSADGPVSHDILAQKEQEANRNLNDANIQADFYKNLLKSGYAQYVVSRYETPGIAQSPECMSLYMDALTRTGKHNQADAVRQVINSTSSNTMNSNTTSAASGINNSNMNNAMNSLQCTHLQ
ncbi:i-AAA protease yme1 [Hanseniaspora vineae]